jgi:hypothetical protein
MVEVQKSRMPLGMWTGKGRPMRYRWEQGLYWELDQRPFMLHSGRELAYILHKSSDFFGSWFKCYGLINLVRKSSRQPSFQVVGMGSFADCF